VSDDLFAELSEKLRLAHRRVASLDVDDEQKARVTRRLLAVTNTSKRDLGGASRRLDVLLADLAGGRLPTSEEDDPEG
jgi:hypothetical protein